VPSKLYGILAAGRPYVAAVEHSCEVAAITERRQCGLVCAPSDAADLASKIMTFYRDPALTRRFGANARLAAMDFDRTLQVGNYMDLFRQLSCRNAMQPHEPLESRVQAR
jgi:colanic acid biosynthesis glycosyl transferase WcaI